MDLLVNWIKTRKELMSLKILRETSKLEMQREEKKQKEIQEMGNNCKRCRIHKMELPEGGEKG